MKHVATVCPLDCPDTCSLTVAVTDADGPARISRIDGTGVNPLTQGFICGKVRRYAQHVHSAQRLQHPMVRDGAKGSGTFRRVSWDQALDLLVARIRAVRSEYGGEAILPYNYGGSNGFLTHQCVDARLFRRLGASRLLRTICAAPVKAATTGLYGNMPGVALQDYVHAKLIVVWGTNPSASGIHVIPVIQEARRRGAKLVVCDPRRTPLARQADLHIPLRPGTDLPVALSIINWLFEHDRADMTFIAAHTTGAAELRRRAAVWPCTRAAAVAGVDAAALRRFAEIYAESSPAAIRCGLGQERNRNGGSATAAILALPAVAGKFGVRGGGFTLSNSRIWTVHPEPAVAAPEPDTRVINMNQLGRALAPDFAPAIKLLFVYNSNPISTTPAQEAVTAGLLRDDLFTVVFDQVHTDTAAYADLLLPATTFLEHRDLRRGYGAMHILEVRPAVAPVGEARPNYEVFAELCQRLAIAQPDDPVTPDELMAAMFAASLEGASVAEALQRDGIASPGFGSTPVLFVDVFPTHGGKVQLVPDHLDREAPAGLYGYIPDPATEAYPLALISPATSRTINSYLGQLIRTPVSVEIHPDDAASRGIGDGDQVRVFNDLGTVQCTARLSRDMCPGVVCLPKGLWRHHTATGTTANALVPDSLTDVAKGACFNDARVQVALA